jgi:cytochrome c-type biogenesis protein CcmH/NrfG
LNSLTATIEKAEEELAKQPNDVDLTMRVAELNHRAGNVERTVELMGRACALRPEEPYASAALAWLLATNPDDTVRKGSRAVVLAQSAVRATEGKVPELIDILAAALAEAGRPEAAVETAERAAALARETSSPNAAAIERRLARHRAGKPIRSVPDR